MARQTANNIEIIENNSPYLVTVTLKSHAMVRAESPVLVSEQNIALGWSKRITAKAIAGNAKIMGARLRRIAAQTYRGNEKKCSPHQSESRPKSLAEDTKFRKASSLLEPSGGLEAFWSQKGYHP
jgi:hypothetical protein